MAKILIVDDDRSLRTLFAKRLESIGYQVLHASDGQEGLLLAEMHRPDLIMLDYQMPVMGGDEMLIHLRQTSWGKAIKVVMMSAASTFRNVEIHLADETLYKPILGRELRETVTEMLGAAV